VRYKNQQWWDETYRCTICVVRLPCHCAGLCSKHIILQVYKWLSLKL
jgi:hypothetical protein